MYIEITTDYDIKEVAEDIRSYYFREAISVEDITKLIEHLNPSTYPELIYRDILSSVEGELPDDLVNLLLTSNITMENIIRSNKVSDVVVQNIIDNHLADVDAEYLIGSQKLSMQQFVEIVHKGSSIYPGSLGDTIGDTRNIEFALYVVQNWDTIASLKDDDVNDFRYSLFNGFGSVLLTDQESSTIFGMIRPSISSNELREEEPCSEGWKRAYKWAGRNDVKYSWNEFIARHLLANQNDILGAKSDLQWLAETLSDNHSYFDHW